MTGPEHYREAERLLAKAQTYDPEPNTARQASVCRQAALVHATLAHAAAVALAIDPTPEAVAAWDPFLLAEDDEVPDGADVVEATICLLTEDDEVPDAADVVEAMICPACEHETHLETCGVRTTGVLVCGCTANGYVR